MEEGVNIVSVLKLFLKLDVQVGMDLYVLLLIIILHIIIL